MDSDSSYQTTNMLDCRHRRWLNCKFPHSIVRTKRDNYRLQLSTGIRKQSRHWWTINHSPVNSTRARVCSCKYTFRPCCWYTDTFLASQRAAEHLNLIGWVFRFYVVFYLSRCTDSLEVWEGNTRQFGALCIMNKYNEVGYTFWSSELLV